MWTASCLSAIWAKEIIATYKWRLDPTSSRCYRIADLCVVLGGTKEKIFTAPPFLCIEILSPEDRMTRVWDASTTISKWLIDPESRVAHIASPSGDLRRVTDFLRTTGPALEVPSLKYSSDVQ